MLKKGVQADYTANVAGQFLAALGGGQVALWLLAVQLDYEVAPLQINCRSFLRKPCAEKLRQTLGLDLVDF